MLSLRSQLSAGAWFVAGALVVASDGVVVAVMAVVGVVVVAQAARNNVRSNAMKVLNDGLEVKEFKFFMIL
jgi:hypothetical protein